jgi:hypothetical protein
MYIHIYTYIQKRNASTDILTKYTAIVYPPFILPLRGYAAQAGLGRPWDGLNGVFINILHIYLCMCLYFFMLIYANCMYLSMIIYVHTHVHRNMFTHLCIYMYIHK